MIMLSNGHILQCSVAGELVSNKMQMVKKKVFVA